MTTDAEMEALAKRLQTDRYGAGDDSQRNIERDQIDALQQKVNDLSTLMVELVSRLLAT